MTRQFETAKRLFNERVDESLTISKTESPRSTRGDVQTVAHLEQIGDNNQERYNTTQVTIQIVNNKGKAYAEVITHILDNAPVALLDWVEVVDQKHRGHNIGRTLHENAVNYIDQKTNAKRIYTKVENPRMQSVNIDTGFKQIETQNNENWYRRH